MQTKQLVLALLCTLAPAVAFSGPGGSGGLFLDQGGVSASLGTRSDKIEYVTTPPDDPEDRYKMKFDLDSMLELRLAGDWVLFNGVVLNAEYAYAKARDGKMRAADYDTYYVGPDRYVDVDRAYAKLDGSTAMRYGVSAGWRFIPHKAFAVAPMAGYAWTEHDIRVRHGWGVDSYGYYKIDGLKGREKPRWHGPWLGVQAHARATDRLEFQASVKHQWFQYRASAKWQQAGWEPTHFSSSGDSNGWQLATGASWKFTPHHAITAGLDWSKQRLKNGKEKLSDPDGTETRKINRLDMESWGANIGYRFSF